MMKIVLLALAPSMTLGQTLTAAGFVPYIGYTGTLAVAGTIGPMTTGGTIQTFEYILTGVDSACFGGANLSAANSCGIHIHVGTSCSSNAGMHYFTGAVTTDPWTAIAYTSTGGTTQGTYPVNTGGTSSDVQGRTVIIHNYVGGRIACAVLSNGVNMALAATPFVKYFDYTGSLVVRGIVNPMTTVGTSQTFTYALTGVDLACSGGPNRSVANSCGIHIHVGTSCSSNAGMHYFTGAVTTDPWAAIAYTAVADAVTGTQTSGTYTLNTGAGSGDIAGRSVIIHDYVGGRIACALLGAVTVVPPNTPPSSPPTKTPPSSPPPTIKPCFPSSATVMLASGTERSLGALQLGDEIVVSTAAGVLTTDFVSALSLANKDAESTFLVLSTAAGRTVTLTEGHHVPVGPSCCATLVTADEIQTGDTVWIASTTGAAVPSAVTKMEKVSKKGLHSPVMTNGHFPLVDGVVTAFDSIHMVTAAGYFLPMLETTGFVNLVKRAAFDSERKFI